MDKEESSILIDTDVLINFFDTNKQSYEIAKVAFGDFKNHNIIPCISIITIIEILQGNKSTNDKNRISKQLIPFTEIDLSNSIGAKAKELILDYSSSNGLILADALIAATALHFNIPLFTFNKKDFRFIKGLKLYQPSL